MTEQTSDTRKTCLNCGWDKPLHAFVVRPKGKPRMCRSCADKAKQRKEQA